MSSDDAVAYKGNKAETGMCLDVPNMEMPGKAAGKPRTSDPQAALRKAHTCSGFKN